MLVYVIESAFSDSSDGWKPQLPPPGGMTTRLELCWFHSLSLLETNNESLVC